MKRRGVISPLLEVKNDGGELHCERCHRATASLYRTHPAQRWRCMLCLLNYLNSQGLPLVRP